MAVPNSVAYLGFPIKQKEENKKMVVSQGQIKSGTVTRVSKTGLQLDNVNQWYNPAIFGASKYSGPSVDTLMGTQVKFNFIENVTTKGTYLNITSLEVTGGTPSNGNGSSQHFEKKDSQGQITKSVVAYAVFHSPVIAQMLSWSKSYNDSLQRLATIVAVIEQFLIEGKESLSTLIGTLVEEVNGPAEK